MYNNIDDKLKNLGNKHKNGKKILVKNNNRFDIYIWKKNKFVKQKTSDYKIFKYICEFKNKSIEELNYTDLSCLYNSSLGCHSKEYIHFKKKYDRINNIITNLEKFYNSLSKNKYSNILIPNLNNSNNSNTETMNDNSNLLNLNENNKKINSTNENHKNNIISGGSNNKNNENEENENNEENKNNENEENENENEI